MIRGKSGSNNRKKSNRHNPLGQDLDADEKRGVRLKRALPEYGDEEVSDDEKADIVPKDLSKKLLKQVRFQQQEERLTSEVQQVKKVAKEVTKKSAQTTNIFSALQDENDDEEVLSETDSGDEELEEVEDIDLDELSGQMALDPADEAAIKLFVNKRKIDDGGEDTPKTLNDIIMEKILVHELRSAGKVDTQTRQENAEKAYEAVRASLNPKVVEAYTLIAKLLKHYTSGKLPKAFNIIPALNNWEEILFLTRPHEWSNPAMRAATRIFASNLDHFLAQRFYSSVLFPRIRENIDTRKKLNYHLYMALKKSLYKPDAFYKGILLPICESGDCTLREATIIASLLKKVSIPAAHSAVALYKIGQMPYSGANALFIGVLLNKKYALPYEVVDSIVEHFMRVMEESDTPPVLWHQALLTFTQRYKNDLTAQQKEDLKALLRKHQHHLITPEIRREISASRNREDDKTIPIPEVDEDSFIKRRKPKEEMKPSFKPSSVRGRMQH